MKSDFTDFHSTTMDKETDMSASVHRKKRGILAGALGTAFAATIGLGGIVLVNDTASAAPVEVDPAKDPDQVNRVITTCAEVIKGARFSSCTWSDVKVDSIDTKSVVVSDGGDSEKFVNCGNGELFEIVQWSRTTGLNISVGAGLAVSDNVSVLFASFTEEVTFDAGFSWASERTYTAGTLLEVPPGKTGWITHAEKRVKGTGTLNAKFASKGDPEGTEFVIKNIEMNAPDEKNGGAVLTHTRDHTAADKALCDSGITPDNIGSIESAEESLVRGDGSDLPDVG